MPRHTHTYTHRVAHRHTCTHIDAQIHTYRHTYAHTYTHTFTHADAHRHTHIYTHAHECTHRNTQMSEIMLHYSGTNVPCGRTSISSTEHVNLEEQKQNWKLQVFFPRNTQVCVWKECTLSADGLTRTAALSVATSFWSLPLHPTVLFPS